MAGRSDVLRGWSSENRAALEAMLRQRRPFTPIAVLDWDYTCIHGDIADAAYHQLCRDLAFRFEAPGFWDWMTEAVPVNRAAQAYEQFCRAPTPEARLRLELALERQRQAVYAGDDDVAPIAWDAGMFTGWPLDEAREYGRKVIARELARPLDVETIGVESDEIQVPLGLRVRSEFKSLVSVLQAAGWDVWVLSASPQWLVEPFAELFNVAPARVIGTRREVRGGVITTVPAGPIPFSDGKLDAYRLSISRAQPPTFAAGDSIFDWKLLEWTQEVRVLVEPAPPRLREFALWRKDEGETWLLQQFAF